ncbi:alpha/beta hydrolase fold domain-containing protein [Pseudomonas sp.]|uniref:alpha/beta hydrolase fold domain-containing protein n=1 Tax=Pseudomonas sp. TaxID=306 RepID=UPI00260DBC70|nr:alpha/beta hydrolase fold domain-containing protein [Pseudomonas sp.]
MNSKPYIQPVALEKRVAIGRSGMKIGLRIFGKRSTQAGAPLVVYFHGGAFNTGDISEADQLAMSLVTDAVVVSVDYPLASTLRFPESIEAAYDVVKWVWKNASAFGGHASQLVIAGHQAGGNLAAVTAMVARDRATQGGLARLQSILPEWQTKPLPLYLLYQAQRHLPLRTRKFIDFATKWFAESERSAAFM